MTTILADSFTASLARLTNDEQKQAKLTAFDLQVNPDQPGLQFHRIDKSRDPNFWSVRVSRDLRVIVHKTADSLMLVHVAHHDDAYKWAERRRIETHPRTGALQIVEVRERVEAAAPAPPAQLALSLDTPSAAPPPLLFAALSPDDLLSIGVPEDWLGDVGAATEDAFFALAPHLPGEATEALLEYAATGMLPAPAPPAADPLEHPDTLRRFRVLDGVEELRAALDAPFEKWAVFLHPSQRALVERRFSGPARVAGSAGTGKTVVALHRAFRLLQADPEAKVLLTTFSEPLARALKSKLGILLADRPGFVDRVTVASFLEIAAQLVTLGTGRKPHLGTDETVRSAIAKAAAETAVTEFTPQFLYSEWTYVIDAWQIDSVEAYARVPRMGRKNRLGVRQRERLWLLFDATRRRLSERGLSTSAGVLRRQRRPGATLRRSRSRISLSMKRRTSASPSFASFRRLHPIVRTRCSSPAMPGSGSSSSRSPGSVSASMCAGGPPPSASTTGPRTRSGAPPTGCCPPAFATSTGSPTIAPQRSRSSTARSRWLCCAPTKQKRPPRSVHSCVKPWPI